MNPSGEIDLTDGTWIALKSWPDYLYIRETLAGTEGIFLINRSNSRPFTYERMVVLQALERLGLTVKVSAGGSLMSLEDFQRDGIRIGNLGRQTLYNYKNELRNWKMSLTMMSPADPRYAEQETKIRMREELLKRMNVKIDGPIDVAPQSEGELRKLLYTKWGNFVAELQRMGVAPEERLNVWRKFSGGTLYGKGEFFKFTPDEPPLLDAFIEVELANYRSQLALDAMERGIEAGKQEQPDAGTDKDGTGAPGGDAEVGGTGTTS